MHKFRGFNLTFSQKVTATFHNRYNAGIYRNRVTMTLQQDGRDVGLGKQVRNVGQGVDEVGVILLCRAWSIDSLTEVISMDNKNYHFL